MEPLFLGTGAAEALPAMFCRCPCCERARERGGRELRTRSALRLDARHQIDFGPDSHQQALANRIDFLELEHLLVTHSHDDHFDLFQLMTRGCAVPESPRPVDIHIQREGARWAIELLAHKIGSRRSLDAMLDTYRFAPLDYFQEFRAGELEVAALRANHAGFGPGERGLNYLVRLPGGRSLLYAVDTGWYEEETWEYLSGRRADIVVIEATFGGRTDRGEFPDEHLDALSAMRALERMAAMGFIDGSSSVYATHINHKHELGHEGLQAAFDRGPVKVTVAWDGLRIT